MNQQTDRERIIETEMALAHLQHDYESLNEVVLEQQQAIEQLSAQLLKLQAKFDAGNEPESRDAEAERPPHY